MSGKRVLVTGGAGFIGSHLVDALAARGDHVIVVDDLSVGARENVTTAANVELHVCDVLDGEQLEQLCRDVDLVFHLATQCVRVSLFDPEKVHKVNTEGTLRMLMAARAAGVPRFVYVSSSEVYGSAQRAPMDEEHPCAPTTIYGASKLAGEHYTHAFRGVYGMQTLVVRPFNTYGPRSHFEGAYGELIPKFVVRALAGQRPIVFGDGEQTRDFTFVEDTVRGLLLASDSTSLVGRAVNIARGEEVSVNQIARLVLEACGRPDLAPQHGLVRPADVRRHTADISLARRELRFEPVVNIADGIRLYVDWFRAHAPDPQSALSRERAYNWRAVA